jgi:hypothetical protein
MSASVSINDVKAFEEATLDDLRARAKQLDDPNAPKPTKPSDLEVSGVYGAWVAAAVAGAETEASESDKDRFSTFINTMESLTSSFGELQKISSVYYFGYVSDFSYSARGDTLMAAGYRLQNGRIYIATSTWQEVD